MSEDSRIIGRQLRWHHLAAHKTPSRAMICSRYLKLVVARSHYSTHLHKAAPRCDAARSIYRSTTCERMRASERDGGTGERRNEDLYPRVSACPRRIIAGDDPRDGPAMTFDTDWAGCIARSPDDRSRVRLCRVTSQRASRHAPDSCYIEVGTHCETPPELFVM